MIRLLGAAVAMLVKVACPHCGEVQTRARKPKTERYRCHRCHRLFTRAEGDAALKRR